MSVDHVLILIYSSFRPVPVLSLHSRVPMKMAEAAAAGAVSLKEWLRCPSPLTCTRLSTTKPSTPILILDGGVSTHLERKLSKAVDGSSAKAPFAHRELWSSSLLLTPDGCDAIRDCHRDFLLAGADIIETVTYQVHYMPLPGKESDLQRLRLDDDVVDKMLQDGVRLAREAVEQHRAQTGRLAHIAASIGSLGGALADGSEYTGRFGLSMEQLASFHKRKLQVLASEHPDVIAFETIPCILECEAVLSVLNEVKDECNDADTSSIRALPPVWLSLGCSDGDHLNDGSKITDALSKIDDMDPNADLVCAIGINCCSFNYVTPLLDKVVEHMLTPGKPDRAIVFYPNSGEEWDAANEKWREGTGTTEAKDYAEGIMTKIRSIHNKYEQVAELEKPNRPRIIVGGCCRTTPETITAIRNRVEQDENCNK